MPVSDGNLRALIRLIPVAHGLKDEVDKATTLETTKAADIHVQAVHLAAGCDVPGPTEVHAQFLGGQVGHVDAPGAADGEIQLTGLQIPDLQATCAREIHPLQVFDGHMDPDRPGGIHTLGPIRLVILDIQGTA